MTRSPLPPAALPSAAAAPDDSPLPPDLIDLLARELGAPADPRCTALIAERLPALLLALSPRQLADLHAAARHGGALPMPVDGIRLRLACAWWLVSTPEDGTLRRAIWRAVADGALSLREARALALIERFPQQYQIAGLPLLDAPLAQAQAELARPAGGAFAAVPKLGAGTIARLRTLLGVPVPDDDLRRRTVTLQRRARATREERLQRAPVVRLRVVAETDWERAREA